MVVIVVMAERKGSMFVHIILHMKRRVFTKSLISAIAGYLKSVHYFVKFRWQFYIYNRGNTLGDFCLTEFVGTLRISCWYICLKFLLLSTLKFLATRLFWATDGGSKPQLSNDRIIWWRVGFMSGTHNVFWVNKLDHCPHIIRKLLAFITNRLVIRKITWLIHVVNNKWLVY